MKVFTNLQYGDSDYSEPPESGTVCEIRRTCMPPLQATFLCIVPAPVVIKHISVLVVDAILTHCGRVTQICVFILQLCRTGDADLRFYFTTMQDG